MGTIAGMSQRASAPRGRHAPPLEVRLDRQRRRLFRAAAIVFARQGYAEATAEGIAREAGMSKATFYEHFDNKEDCVLALFDAASEVLIDGMREAGQAHGGLPAERYGASIRAFLGALAAHPEEAQTLLVEVIGAGPRAMERRDRVLDAFAEYIDATNAQDADSGFARFASPDDAYAIVGAVVELASRQLRTGRPADIRELAPVIERLVAGILAARPTAAA